MKRSKLEARNGILTWKWILEYLDQLWNHVEMRACRQQRHRWKFLQYLHLHLRQKNTYLKCEAKECTRKHSGLELSGQRSAELPDAGHASLLVQGSHTPVNARHIKMPGKDSRRTASAEEARRGIVGDPDTQPLDPSSSSTDPNPKRSKTTSVTDDSLANQMDEDTFKKDQRHLINWSQSMMKTCQKKARVARNVFSIRGENGVKFDVNEEAWPNADLAIRATCEGALIDGLPADKVKAGDEGESSR